MNICQPISLHIAIISYGYPPIKHISGTRAAAMAAELCKLGHQVTVVTVDWRNGTDDRPETFTAPDEPSVIRIDPRAWHPGFHPTAPFQIEAPPRMHPIRRRTQTLLRMFRWGPRAPWAKAAFRRLMTLHASRPVDVVWAIRGDDSCHEIAYRFSRATGVPWVADFKDPWDVFHPGPAKHLQWLATRRRLQTASALTEASRDQATSDEQFGRPVHAIWSGYDADLMESATHERTSSKFSVVHVGNIGRQEQDAGALPRVLKSMIQKDPNATFELNVYGADAPVLQNMLKAENLSAFANFLPAVSRETAYGLMKSADILLFVAGQYEHATGGRMPFKIIEYLASGTPVLCMGKLTGELEEFAELPQVMQVTNDNLGVQFLIEEFNAVHASRPSKRRTPPNSSPIRKHAWKHKAADLAAVLQRAASTKRGPS